MDKPIMFIDEITQCSPEVKAAMEKLVADGLLASIVDLANDMIDRSGISIQALRTMSLVGVDYGDFIVVTKSRFGFRKIMKGGTKEWNDEMTLFAIDADKTYLVKAEVVPVRYRGKVKLPVIKDKV